MHKTGFLRLHVVDIFNWPLWQQFVLCLGLSFLLLVILHLIIGAATQRLEQRQQTTLQQLKHHLLTQRKQLLIYKNNSHFLLKPISVADLLSQLSQVARVNQLEFDAIKPLAVIKQQRLWIQPIVLSAHGDYRQLLNFCRQLQQLSAVAAIQELHLESSAETDSILFLRIILAVYSDHP